MAVEKMLKSEDVADILDIPAKTMEIWRYRGTGLRFYKLGKLVRYAEADLIAYLQSRARANTGE